MSDVWFTADTHFGHRNLIKDRMINIGVDVHEFQLVHLDAIADLIKAWHS